MIFKNALLTFSLVKQILLPYVETFSKQNISNSARCCQSVFLTSGRHVTSYLCRNSLKFHSSLLLSSSSTEDANGHFRWSFDRHFRCCCCCCWKLKTGGNPLPRDGDSRCHSLDRPNLFPCNQNKLNIILKSFLFGSSKCVCCLNR